MLCIISYGISWAYLAGDVAYETYKAYRKGPTPLDIEDGFSERTRLGVVATQRAVFQSLASMWVLNLDYFGWCYASVMPLLTLSISFFLYLTMIDIIALDGLKGSSGVDHSHCGSSVGENLERGGKPQNKRSVLPLSCDPLCIHLLNLCLFSWFSVGTNDNRTGHRPSSTISVRSSSGASEYF
jgi:hypothetical protein